MDDLLALMDDCPPVDVNTIPTSSSESTSSKRSSSRNANSHVHTHALSTHSHGQSRSNSRSNSTIDPLTKIRIVNRQTSKVDLIDIFAPFTFHTTAILASMSNQSLSSIVIPNNKSSLSGRTNAATMGIIFKNSGTRISKNSGKAFTIVTLGDLHTGPTITIMLFGQAYSKYTTLIKCGQVVAFAAMNLLPIKENHGKETRISFSVTDVDQIILVGTAMDYGICAGQVSGGGGHNHGGNYNRGEKKRCKNYVDLRIAKYCQYHIRQQNKSSSSSSQQHTKSVNGKKGKVSALQAMKSDRAETQLLRRQMMNTNRINMNGSTQNHHQNANSNAMTMVMPTYGGGAQTVVTSAPNTLSSSVIDKQPKRSLINVPMHMTKNASNTLSAASCTNRNTKTGGRKLVHNPYAKPLQNQTKSNSSTTNRITKTASHNDVLGQVLGDKRKSSAINNGSKKPKHNTNKRRKYVPSHQEGFDGQVFVPKPNTLFNSRKSTSNMMMQSPAVPTTASINEEKAMMLEKQRNIAEQMRLNRLKAKANKGGKEKPKTSMSTDIDTFNDFSSFKMSDSQRAKALESKSRYEIEANAELFAKSRNVLTELEKKETTFDKRSAKKTRANDGGGTGSNITMQWVCVTCKRTTRVRPGICIRQNHVVKRKREIKRKETAVEKKGSAKMILGAGLEWSGWNGCQ
jgi:minichromosome maintenance protein 10